MIEDSNPLIRGRIDIIYEKINSCLIDKLVGAPLYPRELANISSLKQKYKLIDTVLSFYSNFLTIMEEDQNENLMDTIENAEHTRNVFVNLLQVVIFKRRFWHTLSSCTTRRKFRSSASCSPTPLNLTYTISIIAISGVNTW